MPDQGPLVDGPVVARSPALWVLGGVLVVLATASTVVLLAGSWGITVEYGSEAIPWLVVMPWCLVPAVLWAGAFVVLRRAAGRGSWALWIVAAVSWVALVAVSGTAVAVAAHQHDADVARAAAACSDLDRALYEGLSVYRPDLATPQGEDDGSCSLLLPVPGDAATALATLDVSMRSDGWTPSGTGAGPRFYTRGTGLVTAVPESTDKGYTDIRLSLAPD
jgi:hypothetical protein